MASLLYQTIIYCHSWTALFTLLPYCTKPAVKAHNRGAAASVRPQLLDAIMTVYYSILYMLWINTFLKTATW